MCPEVMFVVVVLSIGAIIFTFLGFNYCSDYLMHGEIRVAVANLAMGIFFILLIFTIITLSQKSQFNHALVKSMRTGVLILGSDSIYVDLEANKKIRLNNNYPE